MKQDIIDILKSSDEYVSGEKISQKLGISRSAVWKHINALRKEGYVVESVTNRGYRLSGVQDVISEYEIKSGLRTEFLGQNVKFTHKTDSTNNDAKRSASMPDGTLFVAEIQTGGKGRLGRAWTSPDGSGIWMSILLKPDIEPGMASQITLVAGLAVCRALKRFGAMIKWPNDVIIGGKKVCGILTEMSAEIERVNYVVCGIGINVNIKSFPDALSDKAASIYTVTGKAHLRADIIRSVLEEFEPLYLEYLRNGLKNIAEDYKNACVNIGSAVTAIYRDKEIHGTAVDITDTGELVIDTGNGKIAVSSGEVSVRGVYGYV